MELPRMDAVKTRARRADRLNPMYKHPRRSGPVAVDSVASLDTPSIPGPEQPPVPQWTV